MLSMRQRGISKLAERLTNFGHIHDHSLGSHESGFSGAARRYVLRQEETEHSWEAVRHLTDLVSQVIETNDALALRQLQFHSSHERRQSKKGLAEASLERISIEVDGSCFRIEQDGSNGSS